MNTAPGGSAGGAPSPTIAAAPAAAACAAKASPSALVPGTATNTSPRLTLRLSAVTPVASIAPVRASSEASPVRRSESFIGLCGGCDIAPVTNSKSDSDEYWMPRFRGA